MAASRENVVEVSGLFKGFGPLKVLNGIEFFAREGEIVGLLGPSGSGKTTLLNILVGLEKPDSGTAVVLGADMRDAARVRRKTGFVPQNDLFYDDLTTWENIAYFGRLYGLSSSQIRENGAGLLERVGLAEKTRTRAGELSGGQRKRLNFILSLLHSPRVLFVDEPTVGLDPVTRRFIWKFLDDLRKGGATILMTTHYMNEAEIVCDRIAILDKGAIVMFGTFEELKRQAGGKNLIKVRTRPGNPEVMRDLVAIMEDLEFVDAVTASEGTIFVRTSDVDAATEYLYRILKEGGEIIHLMDVTEPTLEDVFFIATGRKPEQIGDVRVPA
ncbi:MAG: ABC transporter ATP-binding protein [Candidatus Micrarchaeota archaeon]|nr:ABC transporter ATP-binding protein [Candidatus Micrarchaeota archaeon]